MVNKNIFVDIVINIIDINLDCLIFLFILNVEFYFRELLKKICSYIMLIILLFLCYEKCFFLKKKYLLWILFYYDLENYIV